MATPPLVHHLDRHKDAPELVVDADLQAFLYANSSSKLSLCNSWNSCNRRRCPWCARRVAAAAQHGIRSKAYALGLTHSVLFTCTLPSTPTLGEALADLRRVRAEFTKRGWLKIMIRAWSWHVEVTHSALGWHAHLHFVLLDGKPIHASKLGPKLVSRWLVSAAAHGLQASRQGQRWTVHSSVRSAARYGSKGIMTQGHVDERGFAHQTPRDILASFQRHGDADAAALWAELDSEDGGRYRWFGTGGELWGFKDQAEVCEHDLFEPCDVCDRPTRHPVYTAAPEHRQLSRRQEWAWSARQRFEVEEETRQLREAEEVAEAAARLERESTFIWNFWPRQSVHDEPVRGLWGGPDVRTLPHPEPTPAPAHESLDLLDLLDA